jgi:MFS family permease
VSEPRHTLLGPPSRDFRLLWWATAVSVLGTWAAGIALAVRTYSETHQPGWVSAVFAAEFLPPVVIGLTLGGLLNRLSPRRALVGSDLVSAAVFAVLALVHQPAAVVALAGVAGAAGGVFRPIALGAVPAVVEEREIEAANGSLTAVDTAMSSIGQAAAGAAIAAAGAGAVLGANSASFLVSAALLASCRSLATAAPAERPHVGARRQLRRSLRAIRRSPALRQLALSWVPMLAVVGVVNSIEVPLLLGPFRAGPALAGLAIAAATAGQVLGSLLAGRAGTRLASRYPLCLAVLGGGILASGLSPLLGLVVLCFIVYGIANGLAVVHNRSSLQRWTEPAERPAILALLMSAGAVMITAGAAGGGALASLVSTRAAFVAAGVVGLAAAAAATLTRPRGTVADPASAAPSGSHSRTST